MEFACRQPRTVELEKPINLTEEDHRIFPVGHCYQLPEQRISVLANVTAFGRGPLRRNGEFLAESFVAPDHLQVWRKKLGHVRLAAEQLISRKSVIEGPVVWITDNWSGGYFHWFCDALPRLELALTKYAAQDLTLVLPCKFRRHSYFIDSLRAFRLGKIRILNQFERVECPELVLPHHIITTGNHDPDLISALRKRFFALFGIRDSRPARRVYISREIATRRRIKNEQEVTNTLSNLGYEKVLAERLAWREQIELMSQTEFLISNHGSGLTNMIGMRPGSSMMEIRDRQNTFQNCFWSLASAAQVRYHYLLADKVDASAASQGADVVVDCDALAERAAAMAHIRAAA